MHLVTPCGRYGKEHGEPFLRRRGTNEPQETPRRYYETDEECNEGREASAAAWQIWKEGFFGNQVVLRMAWFELIDSDLREIARFVNGDQKDLQRGIELLQDRLGAAKCANERLEEGERLKDLPRAERDELREYSRRGPPFLAGILKDLKDSSRRDGAKEKLATLCDDVAASTTMRPALSAQPSYLQQSTEHSTRQQLSSRRQPNCRAESQIRISTHANGEEFGLAHNSGEITSATARPAGNNMCAPTVAPATARNQPRQKTSRPNGHTQQPSTRASSSRARRYDHSTVSEAPTLSSAQQSSHRLQTGLPPTYALSPPGSTGLPSPLPSHTPSTSTNIPPHHRRTHIAAPAPASPQTMIHMVGGGTNHQPTSPAQGSSANTEQNTVRNAHQDTKQQLLLFLFLRSGCRELPWVKITLRYGWREGGTCLYQE